MRSQKATLTVQLRKVAEFRRATGWFGADPDEDAPVPPTFPVALEHEGPPIVDLLIGMGYAAERLLQQG